MKWTSSPAAISVTSSRRSMQVNAWLNYQVFYENGILYTFEHCRVPKCWDYVEFQPHIHIRLIPVFIEYNVLQCGEN